jgi:hypothetical protein
LVITNSDMPFACGQHALLRESSSSGLIIGHRYVVRNQVACVGVSASAGHYGNNSIGRLKPGHQLLPCDRGSNCADFNDEPSRSVLNDRRA